MNETFRLWDSQEKKVIEIEAKKVGKEWKARCPNHDDKIDSLSINKEKEVYNCFGCSFKGHLYNPTKDLTRKPKKKAQKESIPINYKLMGKGAKNYHENIPEGIREYLRVDRGLSDEIIDKYQLGYCERHPTYPHSKEFPTENRLTIPIKKKDGKIVNIRYHSLKDEKPKDLPFQSKLPYATWLYPEEQLENDTLIFTEGELDALCCISQGLPAITRTCGATTWNPEFNSYFKDKTVNIIQDCDKAGREGTLKISQELSGIAREIRIIDLGLKEKEDLTDWFVTYGKSKEELQKVIANKEEEQPKYDLAKVILTSEKFLKIDTPEKKTILSPWLKEKQIVLISGWRGIGKTWLGLSLVDAITRGQPFASWKVESPVNCLYLDAEMVKPDLDERLLMLNPDQERQSQLSIYSSELASIVGEPGPCLFDLAWQSLFKDFLLKNEIKLWVADNVTSLTPRLDENVKSEWDSVNEWLKQLRFAGITTILIHHLGKGGTQRGTSAREDNIDISIQLNHPPGYIDTDGCKFELKFTKARIRDNELKDISDLQLQLREDEKGQSTWTYGSIKKSIRNQILTLFDKGILNQTGIAEELEVSTAYISRVKKEGIRDKLITAGGKLTQSGFMETGKI